MFENISLFLLLILGFNTAVTGFYILDRRATYRATLTALKRELADKEELVRSLSQDAHAFFKAEAARHAEIYTAAAESTSGKQRKREYYEREAAMTCFIRQIDAKTCRNK